MASSKAVTVDQYLAELEPERRETIGGVRDLVNASLPDGYREVVAYGMIGWVIPLETYPDTYNKQPLAYAALAAQKNYNSLYLNCVYTSEDRARHLAEAFARAGKKLDMGKSCIRFKKREDLPEDVIAAEIASTTPEQYIAIYEEARSRGRC